MLFNGRNDASNYGELKHCDRYNGYLEMFFNNKVPHAGEGLLILEIQDRLLSFLVACAKTILHDMTDDGTLLDAPLQSRPPVSIKASGETASWTTLAAEAPYRVPSHLDFSQLRILLATKRDAAGDYILALREDPGFYYERMRLAKEHRQECIRDILGNEHHLFRTGREDLLWTNVLGHGTFGPHIQYGHWAELCTPVAR
jgi:hypothetical protein